MYVKSIMSNLPGRKGVKEVQSDIKTKDVVVMYQKDKENSEVLKIYLGTPTRSLITTDAQAIPNDAGI